MKISKSKLKDIIREELASITENSKKFFIVDPTGMRGEPAYYRRKSTNDDTAFEFSTLFGATGFDDKGRMKILSFIRRICQGVVRDHDTESPTG